MATPNPKLQRTCAVIVLGLAAVVSSGCAARASYEYDEPVVYRRERVYEAPPPVVVYRDDGPRHYHAAPPPAYRGRVGVYRAPIEVHRPPAKARKHGRDSRHSDRDDDRRHHR
jgi:hypothetical protein